MAPTIKPSTNQMRLDGFFSKFRRPEGATPPAQSLSLHQEHPSHVKASTRPIQTPSLPLKPTIRTVSAQKRLRDDDVCDEGGNSDIQPPGRKSPRMSPEASKTTRSFSYDFTSSLSSLKSPTPPPWVPTSTGSLEPTSPETRSTRNQPSHLPAKLPQVMRPSTSSSNKSVMASFTSNRTSYSSAQRVVRNGEEMVRNSDSEGSDDSLEDLDDILGPRKTFVQSSSPLTELSRTPTPPGDDFDGSLRRSARTAKTASFSKRPDPEQPKNKLKSNLDVLLVRSRERREAEERVEQTMKEIERLQGNDKHLLTEMDPKAHVESLVKEANQEETQAERLVEAINRTETLAKTSSWSFLDYDQMKKRRALVKLPELDCGDHPAEPFLRDAEQVKDMLVSGIFKHIVRAGPLTPTMCLWLFQHSLYDPRNDVRSACLETLKLDSDLPTHDMCVAIQTELGRMGMKREVSSTDEQPVTADRMTNPIPSQEDVDWTALRQIIQIISVIAPGLDMENSLRNLRSLACMAIDNSIVSDVRNQSLLSSALGRCLGILYESREIMTVDGQLKTASEVALGPLFRLTVDGVFRARILNAIPSSNYATSVMRRKLAMAWFYDDINELHQAIVPFSREVEAQRQGLAHFVKIRKYMKQHREIFKITRETNWSHLRPKMAILTVGIGNGDPPSIADSSSPTELSADQVEQSRDSAQRYNDLIDWFANIIGNMHSLIVDKGTSHITRTESKDLLYELKTRLIYSLRTTLPTRKNFFDEGNGDIKSFITALGGKGSPRRLATDRQLKYNGMAQAGDSPVIATTIEQDSVGLPSGNLQRTSNAHNNCLSVNVDMVTADQQEPTPPDDYHDASEGPNDMHVKSETEDEEFLSPPETAS